MYVYIANWKITMSDIGKPTIHCNFRCVKLPEGTVHQRETQMVRTWMLESHWGESLTWMVVDLTRFECCLIVLFRWWVDLVFITGWWFRIFVLFFPSYWECHHPNWLSYFSEGLKPPTRRCLCLALGKLDGMEWTVLFWMLSSWFPSCWVNTSPRFCERRGLLQFSSKPTMQIL